MSADNHELRWVGGPGAAAPAPTGPRPLRRFVSDEPEFLQIDEVESDEPALAVRLMHYLHVVWRRRWLVAACLLASLAIALATTLLTTPLYRATMVLDIEREPAKVAAVESAQAPADEGAGQFYQTQYAALRSRSLAERIVRNMNLASDPQFMGQYDPRTGEMEPPRTAAEREARENAAVALLMGGLDIEPVTRSRLVNVSYESPDPEVAARIANAVAPNFISANLERRYGASAYARQFLETRLGQIRQRLEESERALVDYAARNEIINIAQGVAAPGEPAPSQSLADTQLATTAAARAQSEVELAAARAKWMQSAGQPATALPEVLGDGTYRAAEENLARLKADYEQELEKFQPTHRVMARKMEVIRAEEARVRTIAQRIKNTIRDQYNVALARHQQLSGVVSQNKGQVLDTRNKEIAYNILQREVDTNRILYDGLLQRYKEIGVAAGIGSNNISVLDSAEVPGAPFKPELLKSLFRFGLIGLLLGLALAFLVDQFDASLKNPEDVEEVLHVPLLGAAPLAPVGDSAVRTLEDPRSPLSEGYHSVRTALQFSTEEGVPSSLLVTSSRAGEGKTTTALAIATSFARLGKRVLIVDGDLRAPSLHQMLARDNGVGLSSFLTSATDLWSAVQPTDQKNLAFLASGPLPPSPAELFSGERMWQLFREAAQSFDLVVIDGPPVLGLADAPSIANHAEATVMVVEAGRTHQQMVKTALRRLRLGRARLVGVVLTKFDRRHSRYPYGHGLSYTYTYGDEAAPTVPGSTVIARIKNMLTAWPPAQVPKRD